MEKVSSHRDGRTMCWLALTPAFASILGRVEGFVRVISTRLCIADGVESVDIKTSQPCRDFALRLEPPG